jgi:hypothetical protein
MKFIAQRAKAQVKEISDLKNDNATLAGLLNEQRAQIADLTQQIGSLHQPTENKAAKVINATTTSNPKTLLIGDSIIKDINEAGLENTKVECLRGARIADIASEITDLRSYEAVIVHGGTNDCTEDKDIELAKNALKSMVDNIHDQAHHTQIYLSTIFPRTDEEGKHQNRVDNMNTYYREIADKTEHCDIIDNDSNFKMRNNEADDNALNGSKLHLSKSGTRKLLRNLNAKRHIIKTTTRKPVSEHSDSPRTRYRDNNRERLVNNKGKAGCYFCGEQNHQKKDCKHGKPVKCHSCGGLGHKKNMNLCK